MKMRLSERLAMSADMVKPGGVVADIGCDHAHTCIYLIQNGLASRCIGMDVRTGPLKKAEENIALYLGGEYPDTESVISLRLSFGLDELKKDEAGTIVIAGMGGELITEILERGRDVLGSSELVLQPQTHWQDVRSFLYNNGYVITEERMCRDGEKFYVSIHAVRDAGADAQGTPARRLSDVYYGPCLIASRNPVLKEFLEVEYRKKKYMLERISGGTLPEAKVKYEEIEQLVRIIEEARTRIQG